MTRPPPNRTPLIQSKSWNDPQTLENKHIQDIISASGGYLNYQIVSRQDIDAFPVKQDGFVYTSQTYLDCLADSSKCHKPDTVDYLKILNDYQVCEKRNNGEIDEVWMWGGPYFGYKESNLAGQGAFYYNSSPTIGTSCKKLLPIMGFAYHVGVDNMLHDFGHRTESALKQVFGSKDIGYSGVVPNPNIPNSPLDKFMEYAAFYNPASCGSIHYTPNTLTYGLNVGDWAGTNQVNSYCDDWLNYPNFQGTTKTINCTEWGCNQYGFLKWWLSHLPKKRGVAPDGKLNNWWAYVADYEQAIVPPPPPQTCTSFNDFYLNSCTPVDKYTPATGSRDAACRTTANSAVINMNVPGAAWMSFYEPPDGDKTYCSDFPAGNFSTPEPYAATKNWTFSAPATGGEQRVCGRFSNDSGDVQCGGSIQYLAKTCGLTVTDAKTGQDKIAFNCGDQVAVTSKATNQSANNDWLRVWMERQDLASVPGGVKSHYGTGGVADVTLTSLPDWPSSGRTSYFYQLTGSNCGPIKNGTSCERTRYDTVYLTAGTDLPAGNYYFHCDVADIPRGATAPYCTGAPYCTVNGGTIDCGSDRYSCSQNLGDSGKTISIGACSTPASTPSPTPVPADFPGSNFNLNPVASITPAINPSPLPMVKLIIAYYLPKAKLLQPYDKAGGSVFVTDPNLSSSITLKVAGLPSGLKQGKCLAMGQSGIYCPITGRPLVSGSFTLKATAKNASGASTTMSIPFTVNLW